MSQDLLTQLREYGADHQTVQRPVGLDETIREITDAPAGHLSKKTARFPGWVYAVAAAVVVLLVIGGVGLLIEFGSDVEPADNPTPTTVPLPLTTLAASPPTTTVNVVPTTEGDVASAPQVSVCPLPLPLSEDVSFEPWIVDLYAATATLAEDTNTLGAALTETEDFNPGWENREPVASAVVPVIADLDAIESMAVTVLRDQYGATFSEESGWTFPGSVVPLTAAHLEEFALSAPYYRDTILPAFFEMRTQDTAISYFNGGGKTAGPCGWASFFVGLVNAIAESAGS